MRTQNASSIKVLTQKLAFNSYGLKKPIADTKLNVSGYVWRAGAGRFGCRSDRAGCFRRNVDDRVEGGRNDVASRCAHADDQRTAVDYDHRHHEGGRYR